MSEDKAKVRQSHWTKTRNLTFMVLAVWFMFSFVVHWHAEALNGFSFIGFPLGYYFAVQGSLIVFVAIIFLHNWFQDKIDNEAGLTSE